MPQWPVTAGRHDGGSLGIGTRSIGCDDRIWLALLVFDPQGAQGAAAPSARFGMVAHLELQQALAPPMPITLLDIILLVVMLVSGPARHGPRLHARGAVDRRLGLAAGATLYSYSKLLPLAKQYFNNDIVRRGRRDRRRLPGHAHRRLGHHRAHLRHGARQPGRRARPHARLPVRAGARPDHRGRGLPVLRLAGARPQPAGLGQQREIPGRPAGHRAMADVDVAGRPREHHLEEVEAAERRRAGASGHTAARATLGCGTGGRSDTTEQFAYRRADTSGCST